MSDIVKQYEASPCCGKDPIAVKYNPFNKVVQCHACGQVYVPVAEADKWKARAAKHGCDTDRGDPDCA